MRSKTLIKPLDYGQAAQKAVSMAIGFVIGILAMMIVIVALWLAKYRSALWTAIQYPEVVMELTIKKDFIVKK